jgi:hypothetical protein
MPEEIRFAVHVDSLHYSVPETGDVIPAGAHSSRTGVPQHREQTIPAL